MIDAQTISDALNGKRSGAGYLACCPAHDDRTPSLKISDGDNGRPVVHCKAGCSQEAVISALTGMDLWPRVDDDHSLSREELNKIRAEAKAKAEARQAEEQANQTMAAQKALAILNSATGDPTGHPYAILKRVGLGSLVKRGQWPQRGWNDALLVPIYDQAGKITTVQAINTDGQKDFLAGGKIKGCFHPLGKITGATGRVLIAEGLATLDAVHHATGLPGVMATSAGNLEPVARAVRELAPKAEIIIIADNDIKSDGTNPGKSAAMAAAKAVGGRMVIPDMGRKADAWDLWKEQGADAVRKMIEAAIAPTSLKSDVTDVTNVTANDGGDCERNATEKTDVTDVTAVESGGGTSRFLLKDVAWFRTVKSEKTGKVKRVSMRPGVYVLTCPPSGGPPNPEWVCAPIHVEAVTFDGQENNFGRLLKIKNTLGRWRTWAMPMELLRGDGSDLRGELLAMGVEIEYRKRNELADYLQSEHPERHVHCALQVGWNGDSYVLPDTVIGEKAADVIFQSGERGHDEHTTAGTLAGWQEGIAARAVGNPLLTLAVSASFAGPLLAKTNSEGGGFHIQGDSSTGKSTLLDAACATWGGPNFKRSWRTTANGMEGAAALFNDCLLTLDEISECDPREVGAIVYALGNGRGKQRASRTGTARSVTRWRCFVLSSGERTIGTTMNEGGHRVKAGQAVRLLDIPAARKYGAFDDLQGKPSGSAFSDSLKLTAVTHHGHAGRSFLEKLTRDPRNFGGLMEQVKSLPGFSPKDGEGQEKRAAGRFALVALAGELATEYGLTGWTEGAAVEAAELGFNAWRSLRGRGNDERRQIAEKLLGFIERHGDSRFSDASNGHADDSRVINRAGWYRNEDGHRAYLFTADGMKEATQGFELKRALDVLQEVGVLIDPGTNGERARSLRLGERVVKVYIINAERLGGEVYGA